MHTEVTSVGGCEVLVERFGSGPPAVVLHGEDGTAGARRLIELLAKDFEVHAPRHPGWPGSSRPAHVTTVRDVALVQQEYIERLGESPVIVGLSFGGWVAAEIAAGAPALASALVLVSPLGIKAGARDKRDFVDLYMLQAPERRAVYYGPAGAPAPGGADESLLDRAVADEAIARYCWSPYMHDPTLAGRLRRITAPTVLVSGEADRFVLNGAYYQAYAGLLPAARRVVLAGGHRLEEEMPDAVAAIVRDAAPAASLAATA